MSWEDVFSLLKPIIYPLLSFLLGLLFPSPVQKLMDKVKGIDDAERKATDSNGHVDDLDRLP